jgi:hypothetical protein
MAEQVLILSKKTDIEGVILDKGSELMHEPKTHIIMIKTINGDSIPFVFMPPFEGKSKIECDLYFEQLKINNQ